MKNFGAVSRFIGCVSLLLSMAGIAQAQHPLEILAYDSAFTGGVKVAVGDITGDSTKDIVTVPGVGGVPDVRVFDGATGRLALRFFAFDTAFRGGVSVAVGDLDDDGVDDIVVAPGFGGQPVIKVFDGKTGTEKRAFFAFDPAFRGGVNVAIGTRVDGTTGQTFPTIVAAPQMGGQPFVAEFNAATGLFITGFYAFDPLFRGGVNIATGDFNSNIGTEVVCGAGVGGAPVVSIFDIANVSRPTLFKQFFAYPASMTRGVQVAVTNFNNDEYTDVVTGTDSGTPGLVRGFSINQFSITALPRAVRNFAPFESFTGGTNVAANNDNEAAFVAVGAGAGGAPIVRIFDGRVRIPDSSLAFDAGFSGGIETAVGDLNGDGSPDLLSAARAGGAPVISILDGRTGQPRGSFFAFDAAFRGGVHIASGDMDADGDDDIIVGAGQGGVPQVRVFNGQTLQATTSFFAYDAAFRGGVTVAAGDVTGDYVSDIITGAGAGGSPNVKVFDGATSTVFASFLAYAPTFSGGVNVAAANVDADDQDLVEILTAPISGANPVKIFTGLGTEQNSIFPFGATFAGGMSVAAGSSSDGLADIVVGTGRGVSSRVVVYDGFQYAFLGTFSEISNFAPFDPAFLGGVSVSAYPVPGASPFTGFFAGAGQGGFPIVTRLKPATMSK